MDTHSSNRTGLGILKIHKDVIVSIVSIAALETGGVKQVCRRRVLNWFKILGLKEPSGIIVEIGKNDELKFIEVPLIVKYGYSISEIAERAQENIKAAIEKMTDKSPRDINISVQGIDRN